jgi:Ti-type conjugative transfer relaxase TraA
VNAAAYRRGAEMYDERSGTRWSYEKKRDVVHSELTVPKEAPAWAKKLAELHETEPVRASEALWNRVEQHETRRDAQLAREVELALPRELTDEQRRVLVREFVTEQLAGRGMVADWSIHRGRNENHHAHVLMTMRPLTEDGFGSKKVPMRDPETGLPVRDERGKIRYAFGDLWGTKDGLEQLRERWAEYQNFHLALHGHEVRVDHRSFKDRGVELVPTTHIGVHAKSMDERGKPAERVQDFEAERRENAQKIADRPERVLETITERQAVFSWHEVAREVARHVDDPEVLQQVMTRLSASPERVRLVAEEKSETGRVIQPARYSTRQMVEAEWRMVGAAERMAAAASHGVEWRHVEGALLRRPELSDEQRSAVLHMTAAGRIATVAGAAGAGKSTTLATAREGWEAQGYRVRGAALAGKAADGLTESAGIPSRTVHSLEYAWKSGKDQLTNRDVLVIDEAGMVGSRQLGRVLEQADRAGAKVVLVGDARQLQPIEAGAAFRAIAERVGVVEVETIRRQHEAWARQASQDFARGAIGDGLEAYRRRGEIQLVGSREEAKAALARDWMEARRAGSSLILAHTNEDVHDLNQAVRAARQAAGELGEGVAFSATKGGREFAAGDRFVFLENNRDLGVKNGTLGTVLEAREGKLEVELDTGARVQVRQAEYANVDHGYALTIHKAQGITVDRAHVLASGGMDRHLAYVAMTRHRERVTLYAGRDDFKDHEALAGRLSRTRPKESTLDFAERRGIDTPKSFIENASAWVERGRERLAEVWHRAEHAMEGIRRRQPEAERRAELAQPKERERTSPATERAQVAKEREAILVATLAGYARRPDTREEWEAGLKELRELVAKRRDEPERGMTLEETQRAREGKLLEAQWNYEVAKETGRVMSRAAGVGERLEKNLEEHRRRMAEHREMAPEKPNALTGLMGGRARYEASREAWREEHKALQRRESQLEKRVFRVNDYARHPLVATTKVAQPNVQHKEPELARELTEYRGWRQGLEREHRKLEIEQKRERERRDRGFER